MEYKRGDIFYVKWRNPNGDEAVGSEIQAGRPAVIVSGDIGNANNSNVTVVYLTSQEKRPMSVHAPVICKVPSTALCEQIYTISKERLGDYVRTCTDEEMRGIDNGIRCALALNEGIRKVDDDSHRIRELEANEGKMQAMQADLERAAATIAALEEEIAQAEETRQVVAAGNDVMLARAQAERDVYKNLFESLQAQMMERRA